MSYIGSGRFTLLSFLCAFALTGAIILREPSLYGLTALLGLAAINRVIQDAILQLVLALEDPGELDFQHDPAVE